MSDVLTLQLGQKKYRISSADAPCSGEELQALADEIFLPLSGLPDQESKLALGFTALAFALFRTSQALDELKLSLEGVIDGYESSLQNFAESQDQEDWDGKENLDLEEEEDYWDEAVDDDDSDQDVDRIEEFEEHL